VRLVLAAATLAVLAAGVTSALAYDPKILVLPSQVAQGQTANVYGTGYGSSSGGCSTVSVAVEGQQVASGVPVGTDGKFHATFTVTQFPGSYHVTASQKAANGSTIESPPTGMTVQLNDSRNSPPPTVVNPPTTQPETSPPTGAAPGASPSNSPLPVASGVVGSPSPGVTSKSSQGALNPLLAVGIAVVLLLLVAGVVFAVIAWRRRQQSG
jgi:hypothetical protein